MKKSIFCVAALAALLTGCGSNGSKSDYKVTMAVDPENNGSRAYIMNYDTSLPVDSADVTDGAITFVGQVEEPIIGRIVIAGDRGPIFVLEPGEMTYDENSGMTGTPLNDALVAYTARQSALIDEAQGYERDSTYEAKIAELNKRFEALSDSMKNANLNNPLGYYVFIRGAYDLNLAQIDSAVQAMPSLASSQRVANLRKSLVSKEETSVGKPFKDFEVTYDGVTSRLSDYVGKGKYTLVDFWASWCGPCIRETKTIKELYNRYGDKGLEVLGVAVWDEPDNTKQAIEAHKLPWPQIINTQNVATDIYGISSIPTIILFDPEGNIVSRGKQGEALVADVEAAMANVK